MNAVLALATKELRVLSKDPRGLGNLFVMPTMFLVVMTLALGKTFGSARPGMPNVLQHNVPGWTLFGLFFIAPMLSFNLLEERKLGTFRRLLSAPVSRGALLLGKLLPFFAVNLAQVVTMFAFGALVMPLLGAPALQLRNPFALLAVTVAASLAATSLGLLIASLARTTEQVGSVGSLLVVTMAALGGVMVPRFAMPGWMQTVGLATPHAWALTAYQDVLVRGAGLVAVLPAMAALLGFAGVFFAVAAVRFRWE